ncbi:SpoIIE family protein phosphatase [Kitasatospora sp. NBC_00374]|uniref:SpoIIE family protein phosphatase n=1 Tax=Kitasatospora sp. NBC_00374 TaxID=2975964 RepID=UPI0030E52795
MSGAGREDQAADILDALFSQAPMGLFVFDPDLRIVRYNTAGRGIKGVEMSSVVGHRLGEFAPGFDTVELEALAAEVLKTGTPIREHLVSGMSPAEPAQQIVLSVSMFRLQGSDGSVLGVASAQDVTQGQAAMQRLAVLALAHRSIGTSLDARRTAGELAETAVPLFADAVTVDLLDEALRGEPLAPGPVAADVPLRRTAFRSIGGGDGPIEPDSLTTFAFPTPFTQSLTDAAPRLLRRLSPDEPWLPSDPDRARRITDIGVHSMIVAPLHVHGSVLGVVALYRYERADPFEEDDLQVARELATRTSLTIDNALSYTRERTLASALQRHLLPKDPPPLTAVETAHLNLPGTSGGGGHWYDVIPLSGARVALTVGDVTGHGIEATATMGQLRTALRTLAIRDLPPDELLSSLDETARTLNTEQQEPDGGQAPGLRALASCLYAVYDPATRICTLAGADHPAPVVVAPNGEAVAFDLPDGPALGTGEGGYEPVTVELPVGSLLALHTVGLAAGGRSAGTGPAEILGRVMAHPDRSLRQLCDDAVYALLVGRTAHDASLLLARTRELGADHVAIWTLPDEPRVVGTARRLADHQLGVWGLTELAFSTELIVSELVTNALRYGSPPIRLRMILDRSLICEVSDTSSTAPHLRRSRPTDEGGRGLFLVGQLGERWGTRFEHRGKTIWSEQALPHDTDASDGTGRRRHPH